jgi:Zn-dependent protease with chaperone function
MTADTAAATPRRGRSPLAAPIAPTRPPRYRRQAWLAVVALLAFVSLYLALAGWFLGTAWRLTFGGSGAIEGRVPAAFVGACAALLAVFMIKGVFFIRRGKAEGLVELRPSQQPRLFVFLHQIADSAGAPRPHKVCVSARVNAGVFQDLSLLNLLLPSRKNLEIGLGLVNTLTIGELRAVLAHEFGHFGQRSMAVGRWVYIAHRVTAQLVARRDRLDAFLDSLARSDLRIAWVGWILQTVVWAIRSIVELAFRGVLVLQRALSREMEMQADLVAVGLTGSDALVHALSKMHAADDSWERTLAFAAGEQARGEPPRDLFAVQQEVVRRMAAILDDPLYGRVPPLPLDGAAAHRLFKAELTQPPRMWMTHPLNHEREENAKRDYVAAPLDERPAWIVFDEAAALRERISAQVQSLGEAPTAEPADTLARLAERFARPHLEARYHGVYFGRAIARGVDDPAALTGEGEVADLPQLYPLRLAGDVERLRELERELGQLRALDAGVVELAGAMIRYRGEDVPRGELPALTARVRADRDAVRDRLEAHDRRVRGAHQAAARAADSRAAEAGVPPPEPPGPTHEAALRGFVAAIHYAEHGEAVLRDLQADLRHALRSLSGAGRVGPRRLEALIADCNRLQEAQAALHAQRDRVQLAPGVLARMPARSWAEALGKFELPPADTANVQEWIGAVDGWVDKACNACASLRNAALDELLQAEQALAANAGRGATLSPAQAACIVPADYRRLPRSHEPVRRATPTFRERFLRASGRGPALLRLAAAGSIVGSVLAFGAQVGHADVTIYNGLQRPVRVTLDGRELEIAPGTAQGREVAADRALRVEARTPEGEVIERFEARSGGASGHVVYNVAAASPLVIATAVYGPGTAPPPRLLGAPRWSEVDADDYFVEPPQSLSLKPGHAVQRRVLRGFASMPPGALGRVAGNDAVIVQAVALAHARWDPADSAALPDWISLLADRGEALRTLALRLRESPRELALLRAEQDLALGRPERAGICARDATLAAAHPEDGDLAYLDARCAEPVARREAAFAAGRARWPGNAWFAFAMGHVDAGNGRWIPAIRGLEQARAVMPGDESLPLDVARIVRYSASAAPSLDELARASALVDVERRIERGDLGGDDTRLGAHDRAGLQALFALSRGDTRSEPSGKDLPPAMRLRWLRLAAASDGASRKLISRALALPLDDLDVGEPEFWIQAALALRVRADPGPYERRIDHDLARHEGEPGASPRRMWSLLLAALRPGARAVTDDDLRGFAPMQRGLFYSALAVALGPQAPRRYAVASRRLLFAWERPWFNR